MLKNISSKFALFILSFGVLGAANVFAQANSCALKLYNLDFRGTQIKNAAATAVNIKNGRVYRSVTSDESPRFAALPEGEYDITVSKPGFKRSQDSYQVACENAREGVLMFSIWMEKGSPKQIYRAEKFKIGSENIKLGEPAWKPTVNSSKESIPVREVPNGENSTSKGVLNRGAISLPKPEYPPAAKAVRASGAVQIWVTIDEEGNVISANAVSGHPLLHAATLKAARQAKFKPTLLSGKPVKVTGIILYYFVAQ